MIVEPEGCKMLEWKMQMLDDAKLPRADKNHKKHGASLADLEKQLWVGNSEQRTQHCSCKSEPTSVLGRTKYVLIWKNTAKNPSFLLERKCQG